MSLEFFFTSLVVVLLPGTGVMYTLAIGLGRGFKVSVAAAVGCTLGIVPAALASIVGLAALLHTSAVVFQAIKFLGVIYLIYMAWSILRDGGALDVTENGDNSGLAQTVINGALLNVLNPKLSLFFFAFLPQFVSKSAPNEPISVKPISSAMIRRTLNFACAGNAATVQQRKTRLTRSLFKFFTQLPNSVTATDGRGAQQSVVSG